MSTEISRTARLEARIAPEALAIVRRAAELQGRSLSDFVVAAAQEAAQRAISDATLVRLSITDQERFAAALLEPSALPEGMTRAAAAHAQLVVGGA